MYDEILAELERLEGVEIEQTEMSVAVNTGNSKRVQQTITSMGCCITSILSQGEETVIDFKL